jgi:formate dehydrogenase iron-sulfur subunit
VAVNVVRLPVLDQYLREQKQLTVVERFALRHDEGEITERTHQELIPLTKPRPGEQYGFHVDLDRCTGCKACVTACHSLNGLDEGETWRFVGMLHGGTVEAPVQKTVTTACHHCADPACLNGCPVSAYEKDPVTGIVKHLDDQCIGCQYCTLTCPYEVPQYNQKLGIVRKCDMCSDRLSAGEAPACVQACPNEAISIRVVTKESMLENAQSDAFLPGAPSPGITAPSTTFKTTRAFPSNTLPADFYSVHAAHKHEPLVVMLVLTQLSVGAFCLDRVVGSLVSGAAADLLRPVHSLMALSLGLLALGASVFHLGRPQYAWRAVLGLRTSWMSREILAFGGFANAAMAYAAVVWREPICALLQCPELPEGLARSLERGLGVTTALLGVVSVFCSVMIYHVTLRRFWSFSRTGFKFLMTALVLGVATTLVTSAVGALVADDSVAAAELLSTMRTLGKALGLLVVVELAYELSIFLHLSDKQQSDLKRSALLLRGELSGLLRLRVVAGVLGGLVVPLLSLVVFSSASWLLVMGLAVALILLVAGEFAERATFFAASSPPRMPGGFA